MCYIGVLYIVSQTILPRPRTNEIPLDTFPHYITRYTMQQGDLGPLVKQKWAHEFGTNQIKLYNCYMTKRCLALVF
jgi:hypothetical protein